jgi:hypothetical protein
MPHAQAASPQVNDIRCLFGDYQQAIPSTERVPVVLPPLDVFQFDLAVVAVGGSWDVVRRAGP